MMGAQMHRFGFVCLRCLGSFCGGGDGSSGEALAPRTRSEDVDILDLAPLQLRWVGAGGSHFQVDFLHPSTRREETQMRLGAFPFLNRRTGQSEI